MNNNSLRRQFTVCGLCIGGGSGPCPGDHNDYSATTRFQESTTTPFVMPAPWWNSTPGLERNLHTPIWADSPLDQALRADMPAVASIPPLTGASPVTIARLLPPRGSQIGLPAPTRSAPDVTQK
jgi:hypothetical protein